MKLGSMVKECREFLKENKDLLVIRTDKGQLTEVIEN